MVTYITLPTEDLLAPTSTTIGAFQGASSFAELIQAFDELHHDGHVKLVLEDGDQMFYTASHAGEYHFQDADIEYDDDDEAYEAALVADRRVQLEKDPLNWADLAGVLPLGPEGVAVTEAINTDPDQLVDAYHCVQQLPDNSPLAWLATVPNGYFSGDLTPQQVLALCNKVEATTPYRLFGMGGVFMTFRQGDGGVDKQAVSSICQHVYGTDITLPCGEFLVLPYTGTCEQFVDAKA